MEIVEDLKTVQTVVIPVGGGRLGAGVPTAIKSLLSNCRIHLLVPYTYIKYQKKKNREIEPLAEIGPKKVKNTLADVISVKVAGDLTLPIMLKNVDEFVLVSE